MILHGRNSSGCMEMTYRYHLTPCLPEHALRRFVACCRAFKQNEGKTVRITG